MACASFMQYGACNIPRAFIILTARGRLGREHGNAIVTHTGRDRIALRCPIRLSARSPARSRGFVSFVEATFRIPPCENTVCFSDLFFRIVPLASRSRPRQSSSPVPENARLLRSRILVPLLSPHPSFSLPLAGATRSSEWSMYKKERIGSAASYESYLRGRVSGSARTRPQQWPNDVVRELFYVPSGITVLSDRYYLLAIREYFASSRFSSCPADESRGTRERRCDAD